MNTVSVRPRLDRRYDVIQSRFPQLVGTRDTKADAIALGEWAARRSPPCTLFVFGEDGAAIEDVRTFDGSMPPPAA